MALLKETTVTTSQNGYSLILRTYEDAVNKAANTSTVRIELLLKSNSGVQVSGIWTLNFAETVNPLRFKMSSAKRPVCPGVVP